MATEIPSPVRKRGIGRLVFFAGFSSLLILQQFLLQRMPPEYLSTPFKTALFFALLMIGLMAFRIKNLGRHSGWCLLDLVPLVNLIVMIPAFFFPAGYLRHRKLDRLAKIFGGLVLALFVASVARLLVRQIDW